MTEISAASAPIEKPRRTRFSLILGVVFLLLAGGGGFYATYTGLLSGSGIAAGNHPGAVTNIAFVPLDPIVISLGPSSRSRHLRFAAEIEVEAHYKSEVEHLKPRILDLLNGYLRAVEVSELEKASALVKLRAQMLRRLQIITGEGRVRDLLITEFVLN